MNMIRLNIDQPNMAFQIVGEHGVVLLNRRARYYFQDVLKADTLADGTILVPYKDEEHRDVVLHAIQEAFDKYEIDVINSVEVERVAKGYFVERQNFAVFSEQARQIWNNIVDPREFKNFVDIVESRFPRRRLYPKQLLSSFHLAFSQNACNFSVPGAGKTSVVYGTYAYLNSLPSDNPKFVNKLLIVGPLSSFGPWESEYEECFGTRPNSKRLSGGVSREDRERHLKSIEPVDSTPELTLISYQSVASNLESLRYYLTRDGNRVMVVLDEAHKIKNIQGGIWASSALDLAAYSKARVVLTGTPIPNGYEDIYNLYEFIWPGKDIVDFNVFQLKEMSKNRFDPRIETLIENISPFFIRIKKSDVLPSENFPIVNHEPQAIEMGPVQREIYDYIENKYIGYFEANRANSKGTEFLKKARFIRLMQAASDPSLLRSPLDRYLLDEGLGNELFLDDSGILSKIIKYHELEPVSPKFVAIRELLTRLLRDGNKVVVWGTFIRSIKNLQSYLESNGIPAAVLIGEVPVESDDLPDDYVTREKIIRRFHDVDSEFKVIIANPFAVAESISLHHACHHAVYFERTFNAANFIQSKDRIHRVGLPEGTKTHYHYLVSHNSIDETIHRRLEQKESRMLELIESNEIPLFSENLNFDIDMVDDLKAIIRDYVRRATSA